MTKAVRQQSENLDEVVTRRILKEELKEYATRSEMMEMFEYQNKQINDLKSEMRSLANDLRKEMADLRKEMVGFRKEMVELRKEMKDIRKEMLSGFKQTITYLKGHEYKIANLEMRLADKKKR